MAEKRYGLQCCRVTVQCGTVDKIQSVRELFKPTSCTKCSSHFVTVPVRTAQKPICVLVLTAPCMTTAVACSECSNVLQLWSSQCQDIQLY